jgi:hypothetical protein
VALSSLPTAGVVLVLVMGASWGWDSCGAGPLSSQNGLPEVQDFLASTFRSGQPGADTSRLASAAPGDAASYLSARAAERFLLRLRDTAFGHL